MNRIARPLYLIATALATTALASPAFALDFTPDPSRVLSDPTYLPAQGQLYGDTGYSYTDRHNTAFSGTGAFRNNLTAHDQVITQDLAYGLTNDLSFDLSMDYDISNRVERQMANGNTNEATNRGFSDPVFGLTYRLVDPTRTSPVNWDVHASYSPDLISAKSEQNATIQDEGNAARGGQQAIVSTSLGYKTRSFTVQGSGGVVWTGNSNITNTTTGLDAENASHWDYFFGLDTQTRFTQMMSLNLGATYTLNGNYDATNGAGLTHGVDTGNTTDLSAALNFQLVPNRVVASLNYDYQIFGDLNNNFANPANDKEIRDAHANVFGADLKYVF